MLYVCEIKYTNTHKVLRNAKLKLIALVGIDKTGDPQQSSRSVQAI